MLILIEELGTVQLPTHKYPKYPVIVECSDCGTQYEMNKSTYKAASDSAVCKSCSNKKVKYSDEYIINTIENSASWKVFTYFYPHLYKIVVTRPSLVEIKEKYKSITLSAKREG